MFCFASVDYTTLENNPWCSVGRVARNLLIKAFTQWLRIIGEEKKYHLFHLSNFYLKCLTKFP